jgi:DNA-binding protein HU-beta
LLKVLICGNLAKIKISLGKQPNPNGVVAPLNKEKGYFRMTKLELIAQVAKETGISQVDSKNALESILAQITKTLKKEGRIAFFGLGVFEVVKRKKRQGRNPRTNEPVTIKAHKAVKFKAAKALKDAVN